MSGSRAIAACQWRTVAGRLAAMPRGYASCDLFQWHLLCVRAWERMWWWVCCPLQLHPALPGHHQGPARRSREQWKAMCGKACM